MSEVMNCDNCKPDLCRSLFVIAAHEAIASRSLDQVHDELAPGLTRLRCGLGQEQIDDKLRTTAGRLLNISRLVKR